MICVENQLNARLKKKMCEVKKFTFSIVYIINLNYSAIHFIYICINFKRIKHSSILTIYLNKLKPNTNKKKIDKSYIFMDLCMLVRSSNR